jgi:hypothetical protein
MGSVGRNKTRSSWYGGNMITKLPGLLQWGKKCIVCILRAWSLANSWLGLKFEVLAPKLGRLKIWERVTKGAKTHFAIAPALWVYLLYLLFETIPGHRCMLKKSSFVFQKFKRGLRTFTNAQQLSPTFTEVANRHDVQTPRLELGGFSTERLSLCNSVGRRPKEQNCRSSAPPSKTLPETERPLFAKIRQ